MMKINLQQLLPEQISDESAFQLVLFVKDLAIALERHYFEHMLRHSSFTESSDPFQREMDDADPF